MAVNSPKPTLLCVIKLCVCLSSLYNQDIPFLDFVVLFVFIVTAVIVVSNHIFVMNWSVVVPLGTIICHLERGSGMGGMCRDPRCWKFWWRFRRSVWRRRRDGEPPPPPQPIGGNPWRNFASPPTQPTSTIKGVEL